MISIIIPVYNHQKELEKCLKSIEKQTYKDYEIIIVDDGSSPGINKIKLLDTRYSLLVTSHKGANAARNYGYGKSSGNYLLFCDADIEMRPDMLEKMSNALEIHPDAAYAYSSYKYGFKTFKLMNFDSDRLKKMNYIHTTSLIRREAFSCFDESIKRFQDWDLWLTMLEHGNRGVWVPEILFKINTKGGTMSRWLPKGTYSISKKLGIKLNRVEEYEKAKEIVLKKHKLYAKDNERSLNVH